MNNNTRDYKKTASKTLGFLVCAVVLFACTLLFSPEIGFLRTIPFFAVGGMLCCHFGMKAKPVMLLSAAMTLCMYLASGKGVMYGICFAIVAGLLSALGVFVLSFIKISVRTAKKNVRNKCVFFAVISVILVFVVNGVCCGNIVSFVKCDSENTEYLVSNYSGVAQKKYTSYSPFDGEYRTYAKFYKNGVAYGNDDEIYISKYNDGIRNVFEQDILDTASMNLAKAVAFADGGFYIVKSDIAFSENEILTSKDAAGDFVSRIGYVLCYDGLIDENGKDKFAGACAKALESIMQNDIVFDTIIFCAGDASKIYFEAPVSYSIILYEPYSLIRDFDEETVKRFGIGEQDILSYWQNN